MKISTIDISGPTALIKMVLHQFHWDFSLAAGQSSDAIFPA
jgi:hypothetical protein